MARRLPPLPAIEAFLYAARSPSFRSAALQLALSPSAFSRRLQTLESFTGVVLFERTAPPTLTEAGRRYYAAIAGRLDEILAATEALQRIPERQSVMLMSPPSLATNWLMPRFSRFLEQNPDLDVDILVGQDLNLVRSGKADLALSGEVRDFTGLTTESLAQLEGIAVSPPTLAYGRPPPSCLIELAGHKLLALDKPTDFWTRWLNLAGYDGPSLGDPTRYETWGVMYEAAASGFGLTIAIAAMSNSYLRSGRLIPCVEESIDMKVSYRIAYANPRVQARPEVRRLSAWLTEEMQGSRDEYFDILQGLGIGGGRQNRTPAVLH